MSQAKLRAPGSGSSRRRQSDAGELAPSHSEHFLHMYSLFSSLPSAQSSALSYSTPWPERGSSSTLLRPSPPSHVPCPRSPSPEGPGPFYFAAAIISVSASANSRAFRTHRPTISTPSKRANHRANHPAAPAPLWGFCLYLSTRF